MKRYLLTSERCVSEQSLDYVKPTLVQDITRYGITKLTYPTFLLFIFSVCFSRLKASHDEKRKALVGKGTKRSRRDSGHTTTSESELDSDIDVVRLLLLLNQATLYFKHPHLTACCHYIFLALKQPWSPTRRKKKSRSMSTGARRAAIKARAFQDVKVTNPRRRRSASKQFIGQKLLP